MKNIIFYTLAAQFLFLMPLQAITYADCSNRCGSDRACLAGCCIDAYKDCKDKGGWGDCNQGMVMCKKGMN